MTYNELKTRFTELLNRKGRGSIKARDILTLILSLIDKIMGIDVSATATIRKSYNSLAEANADKTLIDPETNKPLKIGQLISVVADPDTSNNAIYRLASISDDGTPTWERQAPLGDMTAYAKSGGSTKTAKDLEDGLVQLACGAASRYPLNNDYPMSDTAVGLGYGNFFKEIFINSDYDNTKNYSFSVVDKDKKTINLYSRNHDGTGLVKIGTFAETSIIGGLSVMTNLDGHWAIVNFNAVSNSISNVFNDNGFGISPLCFKNTKTKSDFLLKSIQNSINSLSISDADKSFLIDLKLKNAQTWSDFDGVVRLADTTVAFTGWGWLIPAHTKFNAVTVRIIPRGTAVIKSVQVGIRVGGRTGEYAGIGFWNGEIKSETDITVKISHPLFENVNNDLLFLEYRCDAPILRPAITTSDPLGGTDYNVTSGYLTDGTLTTKPLTQASNSPRTSYYYVGEYETLLSNRVIDEVKSHISENLPEKAVKLSLPDKLFSVVGDNLQIFYRGIMKSFDPYAKDIKVTFPIGVQRKRYFYVIPSTTHVGDKLMTFQVRDDNGAVLSEKQVTLVIRDAKSPTTAINVACVGDSLLANGEWAVELNRRLTKTDGTAPFVGKGLSNINFVGNKAVGDTNYTGYGGWSWDKYTEAGLPAFRFNVTEVNSVNVGDKYINNNFTYIVIEVNISDGTGSILCSTSSAENTPQAAGTLTKSSGSGDDIITYQSNSLDASNPFWSSANSRVEFTDFATRFAGGKIDVMYVLLGWNGASPFQTDFTSIKAKVRIFADAFHRDFPNSKLKVMGIPLPSMSGGMGANYGATGNYSDSYGMAIYALNLNDAYQELANEAKYSSFVEFVNVSSQFDIENNMQSYGYLPVNSRNTAIKEPFKTDLNGVHPAIEGYLQIADVVYRNFVCNFCE